MTAKTTKVKIEGIDVNVKSIVNDADIRLEEKIEAQAFVKHMIDEKDLKALEKEEAERMEILRQAEELGITTEGLTTQQILFRVISEFNKTNAQLATALANNEVRSVKKYILGVETKITDKEFLTRLMNMSVPNFYLHLFEDADKTKTDREIWQRINKSGINPFMSFESLLNSAKKYTKVKRRDQ